MVKKFARGEMTKKLMSCLDRASHDEGTGSCKAIAGGLYSLMVESQEQSASYTVSEQKVLCMKEIAGCVYTTLATWLA